MNHKSFNLYPYSHVPFIIHRNIVFKTFVPFTHVQLNSAHYLKNRLSFSIISNLSGLRGYDPEKLDLTTGNSVLRWRDLNNSENPQSKFRCVRALWAFTCAQFQESYYGSECGNFSRNPLWRSSKFLSWVSGPYLFPNRTSCSHR